MGWLSSFLHPEKGYQEGQKQLDKYYQLSRKELEPYSARGNEQYMNLNDIIQHLINPSQLNNQWLNDYSESQASKNAEDRAGQHGLDAASSMGLLGSNTALNAIQAGKSQIGAEDQQRYLENLMQKYLSGAQLAQGLYGTGANAANNLSNNAMNMGQNSAQISYNKESAPGNLFSGLLGLGGSIVGSALSGPIGGALSKRWNLAGGE